MNNHLDRQTNQEGLKEMKNWFSYAFAIFFLCILISGCRLIHIDEQKKPEPTQQEVEMAVSKFLTKEMSPIDLNPPKNQRVLRSDVDGDGVSEGVVIYTENNQAGKYVVLIMKRNAKRQWEKWNQFSIRAEKLSLVGLNDVTKDRRKELIVSVKGKEKDQERLIVYQLAANQARTLMNRTYDEVVIDDFQGNGTHQMVVFQVVRDQKRQTVHTEAELFDYRGNEWVVVDRLLLTGEVKKGNVHHGKVNPNTRGIFVDLAVGSRGGGTTELLIPKNSVVLKKVDLGKELYSYKMINESSRDVNGDGIIEFALMEQPRGTEMMPSKQLPYVYNWYQWVEGNQRKLVQQTYEDLNLGFRFQYPKRWIGNVKVEVQPQTHQVSFYYGKVNQPLQRGWKLFTIKRYHRDEWNQQNQTDALVLKKKGSFVYAAILPTPQERAQLKQIGKQHLIHTKDEWIKHFSLLSNQEKKKKLALRTHSLSED